MRAVFFRGTAGLLAVGFGFVIFFTDNRGRPLQEAFLLAVIGLMFAAYAMFGTRAAEWVMAAAGFGTPPPTSPSEPSLSPLTNRHDKRGGPITNESGNDGRNL